jgi:hypothetical protein
MTARKIIELISNDREYKKLCRNICKDKSLYEDLFQELIIILLEYPADKIESLYNSNQLKWFVIRILKNQADSTTSPFYKKYNKFKNNTANLSPHINWIVESKYEGEYDIEKDKFEQQVLDDFNICNSADEYYKKNLFKEAVELGSVAKLSRKTGIYIKSVRYTLAEFKKELKEKYK